MGPDQEGAQRRDGLLVFGLAKQMWKISVLRLWLGEPSLLYLEDDLLSLTGEGPGALKITQALKPACKLCSSCYSIHPWMKSCLHTCESQ